MELLKNFCVCHSGEREARRRVSDLLHYGSVEKPRNWHCEESGWVRERRGNDDEAICAPAAEERKSRLLRRVPHPASPLRTPHNDTVWVSSTVPIRPKINRPHPFVRMRSISCSLGRSTERSYLRRRSDAPRPSRPMPRRIIEPGSGTTP